MRKSRSLAEPNASNSIGRTSWKVCWEKAKKALARLKAVVCSLPGGEGEGKKGMDEEVRRMRGRMRTSLQGGRVSEVGMFGGELVELVFELRRRKVESAMPAPWRGKAERG